MTRWDRNFAYPTWRRELVRALGKVLVAWVVCSTILIVVLYTWGGFRVMRPL